MIWNATKDSTENIVTKKTKLEQNSCWILNIKIPDLLPCITKCILKEIVNSQEMITEIDCSPNYFCTSNEKGTIQWIFFYFDFPSKAVTIFWTAGKGRRTSFLTYHCQFLLTKIYIPSEQKGLYSSLSNMLPNYDLETSTKSCSHTTTTVPKPTLLNSDS